jgi:hypothetical protein
MSLEKMGIMVFSAVLLFVSMKAPKGWKVLLSREMENMKQGRTPSCRAHM